MLSPWMQPQHAHLQHQQHPNMCVVCLQQRLVQHLCHRYGSMHEVLLNQEADPYADPYAEEIEGTLDLQACWREPAA